MIIVGKKVINGDYNYVVNDNGTIKVISANYLKQGILKKQIIVENATLSPKGRLFITDTSKGKKIKESAKTVKSPIKQPKPSMKEWVGFSSLIGHSWWQYLDFEYFGVKTNTISRVGQRYTSSEVFGMCGKYVCRAEFSTLKYDNMQGFLVGFNLSKQNPTQIEAHIYSYVPKIKSSGNAHFISIEREDITDTGVINAYTIDESKYDKYAKDLANTVNELAKKIAKLRTT